MMETTTTLRKIVFSKHIPGIGQIDLSPFDVVRDSPILHRWVTQPYARYWDMLEATLAEVKAAYEELLSRPGYEVCMGILENKPIFLMERYLAAEDLIADYYPARKDDYGMHLLLAPMEKRIPNFSWQVFSVVMDYLFDDSEVGRVVVEPDVRNEKIHVLNRRAGFHYDKDIELPHKKASLAFCERQDYFDALTIEYKKNQ